MLSEVSALGFRVQVLAFRVSGLECRGFGFSVHVTGCNFCFISSASGAAQRNEGEFVGGIGLLVWG